MKSIYDLTKKERSKYKQEYKKTVVGKEQMQETYRFTVASIVSFILLFSINSIEMENIFIYYAKTFLDIFCTISFIGAVIIFVMHEVDFKIWLTLKLQNQKK